ncbi:MAG: Holliday junction resolvase RuvX [Chloroflexota bacterium]|nr:Holliday junction resolvase RuvX [Chloroflexota bacterium]MCY3646301.1 Holliday junction resolvase RuvX [Chloroflexota bacterium]MDE2932570.1 Holliday junction resolvase RuvX [Chloroflexota bacterium]
MALDVGSRRTGVAVSDELGLYAHPRPALKGGTRAVLEALPPLIAAEEVAEVVVGLPLTLAGGDSAQTDRTRAFVERLREQLDVPVTTWDERLSSVEAARYVPSDRHRDGSLDSAAAAVLLQAVLDSRAGAGA